MVLSGSNDTVQEFSQRLSIKLFVSQLQGLPIERCSSDPNPAKLCVTSEHIQLLKDAALNNFYLYGYHTKYNYSSRAYVKIC